VLGITELHVRVQALIEYDAEHWRIEQRCDDDHISPKPTMRSVTEGATSIISQAKHKLGSRAS
jgi:hypothetical protein